MNRWGFLYLAIRRLETTATVHVDMSKGGITDIDLSLTAGRVPGLEDAAFLEIAEEGKKNCLLSKALASVNISLTVAYGVLDAVATFFDIKANPPGVNKTPQYLNVGISFLTTIAVIIALQKGIPEALIVFGVWAFGTGLLQLFLGLRRRKQFGGQWPMILSGGQSMAAGIIFIIKSHKPNQGLSTLGGYAAVGAIYFLLSAIWMGKAIKAGSRQSSFRLVGQ